MKSADVSLLLIDTNSPTTKRLGTYLKESGFNVQMVFDGDQAANKILEIRPKFILIDLAMPDFSATQCLDFLSEKQLLKDTKVMVLSGHNNRQNVEACLSKGAQDYLVKPIQPMDVLTRIVLLMQAKKKLAQVEEIKSVESRQANYYLQLVELLIKTAAVKTSSHQINFQLLRMLSLALNAVRISLINVNPVPTVIASSDNAGFRQFELKMEKYPELDYVLTTQNHLFIENLGDDASMAFVKENIKTVHFNTMIVLPIIHHGNISGILSARFGDSSNLSDADIRLCQVVAQIFCNYWHIQEIIPAKAS